MSVGENAIQNHKAGFNCAESALLAVSQEMGIKSDSIPRIATAFGGGMGSCGMVCGAVTGAVMAVSLVLGRNTSDGSRDAVNAAVHYIVDNFKKESGSCMCYDLIGIDLRTEEGRKQQKESGVGTRVCDPAIALGAKLAVEALKKK